MKIGIVGNYGNDNNGDESILYGLLQQVKEVFSVSPEDVTVFSNSTQQTSERYGVQSYPLYYKQSNLYKTFFHTFKNNKEYVSEFDLLIIGGGGLLMDFYRREAHLYGTYAMMAKQSKVPYIIYGCGAGPLDTISGKISIRAMCRYATNISVRDPKSKQLLEKIGVKKEIHIVGDPAFSMKVNKMEYSEKPLNVGVSAVPFYNANYWPKGDVKLYDEYTTSMAKNLDNAIARHNINITFFATKYPQDVIVTKDIHKKMTYHEQTKIIDENLVPERLLEVTGDLDLVIGTRLHSLILATSSETPIIAISYHTKVQDFMSFVGLSDRCLQMDDLKESNDAIADVFEKVSADWDNTIVKTKEVSTFINQEALKGLELMKKAVTPL